MNPAQMEVSRLAWDRYWASGAASACHDAQDATRAALEAFWRPLFVALPAGTRVLDIGTGNGLLPAMLVEPACEPTLQCDAIDLAAVCPQWWAAAEPSVRERVRFHERVAAEALPFANACFDLVVSQYGIEYARSEEALAEAVRVLAPGGHLHALVHHARSVIAVNAQAELGHIEWLRDAQGLLLLARHLAWPMAQAMPPPGRQPLLRAWGADGLAEHYGQVLAQANQRVASMPCPDVLGEAGSVCAQALAVAHEGRPQHAEALIDAFEEALALNASRLVDMRRAALDSDGMEGWLHLLRARGVEASAAAVHAEGRLLGWHVRVFKAHIAR